MIQMSEDMPIIFISSQSMQEKGVSALVSVDLIADDLEKEEK